MYHMKYTSFFSWAVLASCTFLNNVAAEEIAIFGDIPFNIEEIDLTYSETAPPRISFRSTLPTRRTVPPFRPSIEQFDLLPIVKATKSSVCEPLRTEQPGTWTVTIPPHGPERCEAMMTVQTSTAIDVLSYATVTMKGHASKPVTIALTNGPNQPTAPLVRVTGDFDLRLSLKPVFSRLDPTHVTTIVFEGSSGETTLSLDRFVLERMSAMPMARHTKGFWVWDYHAAVAHPETLIQDCLRAGVTRMLVQMPHKDDPSDVWSAYAALLERGTRSGVEIFALDGYPEAIYEPAPLIEKIVRLRTLLPDGHWAGIQLDIEPYLLAQFSDPQDYSLYLHVIDTIKAAVGEHARLSVVMPFWFSAKTAHNRPLDFEVMDRVDEVALMSYRTDVDDLQDITEHTLRYGDAVGVPVWLAVETTTLPIDRQVTLIRELRPGMANAYLDRAGRRLVFTRPPPEQKESFRVAHHITVRPERLTFAGKRRREVHTALNTIFAFPHTSLAGVLIHDMPGYFSLAE
jgi:hypothetical protein